MKEFLNGLFSIGEHKTSTLVCVFMALMGFVIYVFMNTHTIDGNVKDIIICFVLTIGGVNGLNSIGDIIKFKQQVGDLSQINQPQDQSNQNNNIR